MLELILCASLTVLPDYLLRRYLQGKRIGYEITLYSVWYELRWGITACVLLTVTLITVIFYNHPTTSNVTSFFRTVPILPEAGGRVDEVFVKFSDEVVSGQKLFSMDSTKQRAALDTARLRVAEVDAAIIVARTDLEAAEGHVVEAKGAYMQALDELNSKTELRQKNANVVSEREIERLQTLVASREGGVTAALANKQSIQAQISTLLPAQKASAEATLAQAQVDLDKTVVYAGVDGRLEQFSLQVGDFVSPIMRPAGLLIPKKSGRNTLVAGFNQIESQVLKVGMAAEVTCVSKPFTVIPMVVVGVQDFIASGQVGLDERLLDAQQVRQQGSVTVFLQPIWEGGLEGVTPGSSCIANAYTNNHDLLASDQIGAFRRFYLHGVDALGVVHAMILRIQALMLPVRTLVLAGGH